MSDTPKLTFRATIPEAQASLKFGGDEARITFAVPACDVEKAVGLIALKQTRLKLTVEVDNDSACLTGKEQADGKSKSTFIRAGNVGQPDWASAKNAGADDAT